MKLQKASRGLTTSVSQSVVAKSNISRVQGFIMKQVRWLLGRFVRIQCIWDADLLLEIHYEDPTVQLTQ